MKDRITLSNTFLISCFALIFIGVGTLIFGFISEPHRAWENYLLNNFYFLSLAIGAAFFLALQSITQSGWSSGFRRIPEAMMMFIPVSGILLLFLYFGMSDLYHWANANLVSKNILLQHKSVYLNVPFFLIRLVVFFTTWIILTRKIRKASLKEDEIGGLDNFHKIETYSKVLIFVIAITFSLIGIDLIMSIDAEWFSTIFTFKNFVAAFQHSSAVIFIIIVLLNRKGYYKFLNVSHIHDFARYIFIVSIFYGYMWFSQFMLTWFGNIPEETIYYVKRWTAEWQPLWLADIIINWAIPFFVLLPVFTSRSKWIVFIVALILVAGQWIDLFLAIFPGSSIAVHFGFIEIGSFLGFAGLFILTTGYYLSNASLVPLKHPYIEESYHHHFESYI
jgi:hypothetical protein